MRPSAALAAGVLPLLAAGVLALAPGYAPAAEPAAAGHARAGVVEHSDAAPGALERIRAAGVLRIGTTGDYAPFSIEREGRLEGADVELGRRLAVHLGVQPQFVHTTWGSLVDDLRAGRFDVALGGISVTAARAAVGAYSLPYARGGKTIVARCRDAPRFRSLRAVDRRGVRVVVNPGGTNEEFVRANVRRATIVVHPDNRTVFEEIRAGRADLMITDDSEVELQSRVHADLCRTTPGTLTRSEKAIFAVRDAPLVEAVNEWLAREIAAGTPDRLREAYLQEAVRREAGQPR